MKVYEVLRNTDLFDIYTSKEEYQGRRDKLGRFVHRFSDNRNVSQPIVSNYLISNGLIAAEWPENHRFAACLTHDIDSIYPSWKYTLFAAAKFALKLRPEKSLGRLMGRTKRNSSQNPYWNFKTILELEQKYDAKSSFYFKATSKDPFDCTYDIDDVGAELGYLSDMGWEIGLHGGFYVFNDPEELEKEKEVLEKALGEKIIGIRMHFLRFEVPETWKLIANLGFKYDSTFGYPDMPGFRNGMCHPFRPYDLRTENEIDILEIPLNIIDGTLFGYLHLEPIQAWKTIEKLIEVTERNRGVITILWHNHTFDEIYWKQWSKVYEKTLQLLEKKNAWMTSGKEIHSFWTKNTALKKAIGKKKGYGNSNN
jgi:peptidoglycan/xylan/chitin deacetylase (PgdA/CDA1 family)